jgi:hypothetical protein
MGSVTAVFHNGRIELAQPVDWPDGTQVEVTPVTPADKPQSQTDWPFLAPFDVGEFRELTSQNDDNIEVSLEEFEAGLDELASASDSLPVLPPEAYTRESIYGDD